MQLNSRDSLQLMHRGLSSIMLPYYYKLGTIQYISWISPWVSFTRYTYLLFWIGRVKKLIIIRKIQYTNSINKYGQSASILLWVYSYLISRLFDILSCNSHREAGLSNYIDRGTGEVTPHTLVKAHTCLGPLQGDIFHLTPSCYEGIRLITAKHQSACRSKLMAFFRYVSALVHSNLRAQFEVEGIEIWRNLGVEL